MEKTTNLNCSGEDNCIDNDQQVEFFEKEMTEPFDPTKIRVDTRPMTIDLVLKRIKYNEINLTPDFQRYADIWTNKAQSRLIESILIRIPLPAFYVDATDEDKWQVIDGLQRLNSLKKFAIDNKLKLTELEFLHDIENKTYNDLPRSYQRRIDETVLTIYLIERGTPPEVKFNIFKRINTGGAPLSAQELRHAMNPGKAIQLLAKLADSKEFIRATSMKKIDKIRMEDRELVLRFLAFSTISYKKYYPNNLDMFLSNAMNKINKMPDKDINMLERKFKFAMDNAYKIFDNKGFRKTYHNQNNHHQINKSLFQIWSVNLSDLSKKQMQVLIDKKEEVKSEFEKILNNNENFNESIKYKTGSYKRVKYRFLTIENLITRILS